MRHEERAARVANRVLKNRDEWLSESGQLDETFLRILIETSVFYEITHSLTSPVEPSTVKPT